MMANTHGFEWTLCSGRVVRVMWDLLFLEEKAGGYWTVLYQIWVDAFGSGTIFEGRYGGVWY